MPTGVFGYGEEEAHGNWVSQHDNARPHTARATQDLLQRSGTQPVQRRRPNKIYVNDDLTATRATLAAKARKLKKDNKIDDT
nr:hypothetical protein BaRGS_016170 [Batillaria attramentaria]